MFRVIALTLLIVILLAGCAQPAEPTFPEPGAQGGVEGPALPVDITGNISDVQPGSGDVLGTIRIEGEKIEGNDYDKAVVKITGETRLWEQTSDGYIPATVDDFQFGATVTASFTGPVMESYPVQATAGEVTLLYRMPRN
ncbi:MAG: hypothetical protein R6X16_07910 [Anaerolineae bacterium]